MFLNYVIHMKNYMQRSNKKKNEVIPNNKTYDVSF